MNDRLLTESDVLKAVDKRIEELSKDPVFIRKNGQIDLYGIKKYLLAIPTAEWPQGEWIKTDRTNCGSTIYKCSVCGADIDEMPTVMGVPKYKYCPYCGADLRGESNE